VACVLDGRSAVDKAIQLKPNVVLLDIGLPVQNGIEAARQIKRALPDTSIVFVTMHANPSYLRAAFEAGALGYVLKTSARDELLLAVRTVLSGNRYVTAGFATHMIESTPCSPAGESLTQRQREILSLIAEGQTAKEMAATLHVSVQTVAFHKYRIMNKLSLRTTAELTKYALREGIAGPLVT
jgi:DNA-binding NarL/FixJ family response regulator